MEGVAINLIRCRGLNYLVEYGDELFNIDMINKTITRRLESLDYILYTEEWYNFDEHEDYLEVANLFDKHYIN